MEELDLIEKAKYLVLIVMAMNIFAIAIKTYIYLITASLAVLVYVLDSLMDTINDIVAYFGLKKMIEPPDVEHPYGHAKYDSFTSMIIAIFILASAVDVGEEILNRAIIGGHYVVFESEVMLLFLILMLQYFIIAISELYFARKANLNIMRSAAFHYITDPAYTAIVFISVWVSSMGFTFVDIILSVLLFVSLIVGAIKIIKRNAKILLDASVIDRNVLREKILEKFGDEIVDCTDIRSRTDGRQVFLELILKVKDDMSLKDAHDLAHKVENFIRSKFKDYEFAQIHIHYEPSSSCL